MAKTYEIVTEEGVSLIVLSHLRAVYLCKKEENGKVKLGIRFTGLGQNSYWGRTMPAKDARCHYNNLKALLEELP